MNGWDCSYEELIDRIDGLQEREMMPMSQCGFVLSDGKARIAIDVLVSDMAGSDGRSQRLVPPPFQADDMPLMDGILVTHSHADHLDVPMILSQVRRNPSVQVVAPSSILDGLDIPAGNKAYIGDYGMVSIGGFSITAVPVPHMEYHESAPGHSDFYGYAISFAGLRVFHSGDAVAKPRLLSDAKALAPLDYAILPVNGRDAERESRGIIGNMHPAEAVSFAAAIGAGKLIPMHFDMIRGNTVDIGSFIAEAEGRIGYAVPVPGRAIRL